MAYIIKNRFYKRTDGAVLLRFHPIPQGEGNIGWKWLFTLRNGVIAYSHKKTLDSNFILDNNFIEINVFSTR